MFSQQASGEQPGRVRFLDASGSKRGPDDWAIRFQFATGPQVYDQAELSRVEIDL